LVWNTKGRTQSEVSFEQSAQENIWTYEGGTVGRMEMTA